MQEENDGKHKSISKCLQMHKSKILELSIQSLEFNPNLVDMLWYDPEQTTRLLKYSSSAKQNESKFLTQQCSWLFDSYRKQF